MKDGKITPAYWCQWLYENSHKGYGLHVTDGQDIFQVMTIEEGQERMKLFYGNKENAPYCPQFDD